MKKFDLKMVTRLAIIAAIYVVATLAFAPLSYGGIQFRLSEVLVLLVLYKKEYSISLILGCFIANLFSPLGWPDLIFGTLATTISVLLMLLVKNKFLSSLIPAIVNGIIVGFELHYLFDLPLALTIGQVAIGEFVVITLIGLSVFKAMENNEAFIKFVGEDNIQVSKPLTNRKRKLAISFGVLVIFIVLFFTFPVSSVGSGNELINYSLFNFTFKDIVFKNNYYIILSLFIPILICLVIVFREGLQAVIINLFLTIAMLIILILVNVTYSDFGVNMSFSIYYIVTIIPVLVESYLYYKRKQEQTY